MPNIGSVSLRVKSLNLRNKNGICSYKWKLQSSFNGKKPKFNYSRSMIRITKHLSNSVTRVKDQTLASLPVATLTTKRKKFKPESRVKSTASLPYLRKYRLNINLLPTKQLSSTLKTQHILNYSLLIQIVSRAFVDCRSFLNQKDF